MDQDAIKAIVKEVIQEELKDLKKTVNRLYEDREILEDLKQRVGTLEDVNKTQTAEIKKTRKSVSEDIADVHDQLKDIKETVKE